MPFSGHKSCAHSCNVYSRSWLKFLPSASVTQTQEYKMEVSATASRLDLVMKSSELLLRSQTRRNCGRRVTELEARGTAGMMVSTNRKICIQSMLGMH